MRMEHLGVRVTTFCNLNCKDCADLVPYEKSCHYEYEDIVNDLDKILGVVDFIEEILLGGGEIFMYPYMNEVIEYCVRSSKIGHVFVVTNGTIMPTQENLKVLKNDRVTLRVSGYGVHVAPQRDKIMALLEEESIQTEDLKSMKWYDVGNAEYRNRTEEEMKWVWDNCSMRFCVTMCGNGKIYWCGRQIGADLLEDYPSPKVNEIVDVRNTPQGKLAETLEDFYKTRYISTCNYCDGITPRSRWIFTATQVLPKKLALDLFAFEMMLREGENVRLILNEWLGYVNEHYKALLFETEFAEALQVTRDVSQMLTRLKYTPGGGGGVCLKKIYIGWG